MTQTNRKHGRQTALFVVALLLPAVAISALLWKVLTQDREIERVRVANARAERAAAIGQKVLDRLEGIGVATSAGTVSLTGPVALVGWVDTKRGFVLPWDDDSSIHQFTRSGLQPVLTAKLSDAEQALTDKAFARAIALYEEAAVLSREDAAQHAYTEFGRARTLMLSGALARGREVYRDLLDLPSNIVDETGYPFACWAATGLIKARAAEPGILARVRRDLDSPSTMNLRRTEDWKRTIAELPDAGTAAVSAMLAERARFLEAAQAFAEKVGAPSAFWQHHDSGGEMWLVRRLDRGQARPLAIVVRAREIFKSVEAESAIDGMPEFRIAVDSSEGDLLNEKLPGLRAAFFENTLQVATDPKTQGWRQWFYGVSLLLVLGMTFVAGFLVWRDTRRELRVAEMRSQFVSSVSHELKTPLTSIRMFAELLKFERPADEQTHDEYLDIIVEESERLTRLLNNVLDFSRIEQGQKNYAMKLTRLDQVIDEAARVMEYPLAQQGFQLRVDSTREIPPLTGDQDALKQAVLNLLTNAVKYSGKSRCIELRLHPHNGTAIIDVTDHGIGIAESEQSRIFETFYRAPIKENNAIAGTGIGLALVAQIVEAHQGSIRVQSKLGEGSTFSICLPLLPARTDAS